MARPSVKKERHKVIMLAFAQCIAEKGLDATSLDDIARKVQMHRSLVRHFSGNRADLICQVTDFISSEFESMWVAQKDQNKDDKSDEWLLKTLFKNTPDKEYQELLPAFYSLLAVAHRYPVVSERLKQCFNFYVDGITNELVLRHPLSTEEECREISTGVVGIYFNWDSLRGLNLGQGVSSINRRIVRKLISILDT
ncbi:MAG TPA: TetR/AcrR family transcriptional regulator [Candidatus Thioglobus sp.]|jgi:AcrR family transcriptional regulator|nr:TetR/AcrR family transcriptional regulator [Candidatus Thioglobus sp.]HIL20511.1 TetR/AcrR family transcriptional regulator [Candidatus Thioglobus sp.]